MHIVIVLFRAVVFDTVNERNGVQHEMIVQVIFFVKVCGNNDLITVAPQAGSQLFADLVRYFGGGLAGGKRLIAVIGHRPAFFPEPLFYSKHFITGGRWRAVDSAYKAVNHRTILVIGLLRLFGIDGIADNIRQVLTVLLGHIFLRIKFRVCGFIGILHIDHHFAEPAFHPPD